MLYEAQGRTTDAEPLYRRALAIGEKAPGPEHPHVWPLASPTWRCCKRRKAALPTR